MKRRTVLVSLLMAAVMLFCACGSQDPLPGNDTTASTTVSSTKKTTKKTTEKTTTTTRPTHTHVSKDPDLATVSGDERVNVRSGPGTEYEKVAVIAYGEEYRIVDTAKSSKNVTWYKLDLGGGKTGYVSCNMMTLPFYIEPDADAGKYNHIGKNTAIVTGAEVVNVRSGAGAGYEKLGEVRKDETYPVLGCREADNGVIWYKLDIGSVQGYVSGTMVEVPDMDASLSGKKAYLTFDDGPSCFTEQILDILDEYGVKATWFVIYHKDSEKLYKKIAESGNTLALHSYSHEYSNIYSSEDNFYKDLKKIDDYVYKVTGIRSKIFRFPGGSSNTVSRKYCKGIMKTLTKGMEERGYVYFDWNVSSGDADKTKAGAKKIYNNIVKGCKGNKTVNILMHDTRAKDTTVMALPYVIEYLQSQHYDILPLDESSFNAHQDVHN